MQASHSGPLPHSMSGVKELPFPSWADMGPGSGMPRSGGLAVSVHGSKIVEVNGVTSALSVPGFGSTGESARWTPQLCPEPPGTGRSCHQVSSGQWSSKRRRPGPAAQCDTPPQDS